MKFVPPNAPGRVRRVVFSGGPAAGKTAILEILKRHLADEIICVPESATVLFKGGFPRRDDAAGLRIVQQAIFQVQRHAEAIQALGAEGRAFICDRGSLDGGAYWPGSFDDFLANVGTTLEAELGRYDGVIFLETSAYDAKAWPNDNPYRIETPAQARLVDRKLRRIWERHPNFQLVPHATNFYEKVAVSLITLHKMLGVDGIASLGDRDPVAVQLAASPGRARAKPRAAATKPGKTSRTRPRSARA